MMKRMILLAALCVAGGAAAQSPGVTAAINSGAVGERYDGYLGVAAAISPAVRSQVAAINLQRRTLYSNLATSRGASPSEVGITAGCQLLTRVRVGQSYMLADAAWRRRQPEEGAPAPDYCR